jgi:endonuclease G
MQPQYNRFNANLWADMEQQLRSWNRNGFRDTLYVCKGGTIDSDANIIEYISNSSHSSKQLNNSYIPVPRYFFMAVLCKNQNGYKALGFWVEQTNRNLSGDPLNKYVVSIDELEALTGIDFFCNLTDQLENQVESASREEIIRSWGL